MKTNTTRVTRYVPIENREGATPAERWYVIAVVVDESAPQVDAMFIARDRHKARGLPMTATWAPQRTMPTLGYLEELRAGVDARNRKQGRVR